MPSDERVALALTALAQQRDAFQAALGTTIEQVQHFLHDNQGSENGKAGRVSAELGPFAAGRIDMDQLSKLVGGGASLDTLTIETIEKARDTIAELAKRNSDLFLAEVKPGGDIRAVVSKALEEIGRAFGAVRVFELTRSGSYHGNAHARSLGSFPYVKWSKGERRLAPPLVVGADGADLRAESLAEFMDGAQKIVLVVRGPTAPAPLVRLVTPGTYVLQTHDGTGLDRLATYEGPGIGALMPESAAQFVHDPKAGASIAQRLEIISMPEKEPRGSVGGLSGSQQAEELRQLRALASATGVPAAAVGTTDPAAPAPTPADPVDKLAAWLLSQADLTNVG